MREELPVAMDQLPQTGHQAGAVHGGGGEADHQPPRHCWQQVCRKCAMLSVSTKWSFLLCFLRKFSPNHSITQSCKLSTCTPIASKMIFLSTAIWPPPTLVFFRCDSMSFHLLNILMRSSPTRSRKKKISIYLHEVFVYSRENR